MGYLIEKPKKVSEKEFILDCLEADTYRNYISDLPLINYDEVYVLKKDAVNIGISFLNIKKSPINNIAYPIIYLDEKYRKDNNLVIMNLIEHLFVEHVASKIVIQIYDNNILMLNCMKAFKINYCGHIKHIKNMNGSKVGISFFDINREEW
ncbi:TPA_asm: hypothetical protein GZM23_14910, partial [Listeria monocytogenes]|nr:hypothetical protein [Listeria monocytogenes]HAB0626454.1 hypothetical protein [Listeria monocytogenes]HAC3186739.1 hypothetical protein [Listeria monocytogenes]HBI2248093.1 hypothetical protein [Listeria monocytogenes]HCY9670199.1 hypothetical protein [Listeria monocytogenes]